MAMRVPRAVEGGAVRGSPAQARGAVSFLENILENIETMGIVGIRPRVAPLFVRKGPITKYRYGFAINATVANEIASVIRCVSEND
jgi:hypothetical protein